MTSKVARAALALAVGAFMLTLIVSAQSKDPFVGSWRLNAAKSKYTPGPAPKSITSSYEAAGKGYKISVRNEPASGPGTEYSYTTSLDGADAKVTGNNPNADTIAVKRIDANTLEHVSKKGGKVTITQRNVVAADGKSRTTTISGRDARGRTVHHVMFFDRQ